MNDRFIALEVRLKEKFEALDKALKLAASGHKAGVSMWLSVVALLIAAASIVVKAFGHA